jgi:N-acetylneuraminic acid mutarotase
MWSSVAAMPTAIRAVNGSMYVLGGSQRVLKYNTGSNSWTEVAPMPAARGYAAVCVVDSEIFVFGGQNSADKPCSDVYTYNTVSNRWSPVSPMPSARVGHGVCMLGGMIYIAGGYDADNTDSNSMLQYDPVSDTWSEMAPMLRARSAFGMFVAGNCIYAVGGAFEEIYIEEDERRTHNKVSY